MDRVSVIIFDGGKPQKKIEKMMTLGRHAALLDTVEKFQTIPVFEKIYLVTNFTELASKAEKIGVRVLVNSIAPAEFHFGEALKNVINSRKLQRVLCMGGGSLPLVSRDELERIGTLVAGEPGKAVFTNNVQSVDFVAFTPAGAINLIRLPRQDNELATLLRDQGRLAMKLLPNSSGLMFDLDTPAELLVLGSSSKAGPRAAAFLREAGLSYERLEAAREVLKGDYQEVFLLGRVGAPLIAHINSFLKVRLRILSEERGMKALGRERNNEVVSLAGYLVEEIGPNYFVDYLSKTADCVFWDTRVLFAHLGLHLSEEERFSADLGIWQNVCNPLVRNLTRAVLEAPIPIICGGHALVSGGLWHMVDEIGSQHPFHFSMVQ